MTSQPISKTTAKPAPFWRVLVVGVLAMALLLVSFGHRPLQAEPQATAYILAGGDWADLCADGDAPHLYGDSCMACLVAQTAHLAEPYAGFSPVTLAGTAHWNMRDIATPARTAFATHPARAPPLADRSTIL